MTTYIMFLAWLVEHSLKYETTKYEIFLQWSNKLFLQKVLFLLHFGCYQNCMSSPNLVSEIQEKLFNKWDLSTGEPFTCEYVTLLQSFHGGILSIHWYIAQNFYSTFSMSVLFTGLFRTVIFSKFSQGWQRIWQRKSLRWQSYIIV